MLIHSIKFGLIVSGFALGLNAGLLCAAEITLDSTRSGAVNNTGNRGVGNYLTGKNPDVQGSFNRSFFVFDLSSVNEKIISATLKISNPQDGYSSTNRSETLTIWDTSNRTLFALQLPTSQYTPNPQIYSDLGEGTNFGSVGVSAADNNKVVTILFNNDGINALNRRRGFDFAVGGSLGENPGGYIFGFTGNNSLTRQLVLTTKAVPEPLTILGVGTALGFGSFFKRELSKKQKSEKLKA